MRWHIGVRLAAVAVATLGIAPLPARGSTAAGRDDQAFAQIVWRADIGRTVGREIALGESCAFAATMDGRVGAVRLADGQRLWRKRHGDSLPGGLVVEGRRLLAASDEPDGRLMCISTASGALLWSADVGPSVTAPIVGAGLVVTAGLRGRVTACQLETGEIVWQRPVPAQIRAPLAVAGDLVLVPTVADTLLALRLQSGDLVWGAAPGGAIYGRPLVDACGVWTLSYTGELVCWELEEGRALRRVHLEGPFQAGAVSAGDALLAVSTGGTVTALDRVTLAARWRANLAGAAWLEPAVDGARLWQALGDRTLRGLRLADGTELECRKLPQVPRAGPLRAGELLLVGLASGELIALRRGFADSLGAPAKASEAHSAASTITKSKASAGAPCFMETAPLWQRGVTLGSPPAGGPTVVTPATGSGPRLTGAGPVWAAGWVAGTAVALWLQHEAEQAHDCYERTGDPGRRAAEFDRAERLDRAVLGVWIASEALFLLMLRNWLAGGE